MSLGMVSIVGVVVVLGGCGLSVGVAVLVGWAILDNSRRGATRDPKP